MQKLLKDHSFTTVLFDMDNTLFDFVAAMERGSKAAIDVLGKGTWHELLSYYIRGKYHVEDHMNLQDFMQDYHIFSVERYLSAVKAYDEAKLSGLYPYEGIHDLLKDLQSAGYKLGLVTDAYQYSAEERLMHTDLIKYFTKIISYDQTGYKKPHHAPFECAMDLLGTVAHETVYVGDSIRRDIEPARALGMAAIYAAYGDRNFYDKEKQFPSKILVAENPEDIRKILL